MASRPKSHVAPKGPRRDVLASLKLAHIEISKPILPAELMSTVLDYLDPIDLINVAKTSRRMHEMVYDDTRWVRLLKQMGYWNELEARKHAGSLQSNGQSSGLISQGWITTQSRIPAASVGVQAVNNTGGFDAVEFTGSNKSGQYPEAATTLKALSSVQSVRGKAREQYGKIHGALYPLYRNVVTSEETTDCLVFKIFDNPEEQAQLLAHLQSFSHVDRSRGWRERNTKLSLVISDFESAALREFIHGYDNGDIEGPMSRYARVLVALNGGHIAIQHFMQQNNIIRQKTDFGRPADCLKPGTVSLEHTQAFLTRLSVAINEEVSIMDRCFPNCAGLSTTFMGMIQETVLSPYFNTLFDELHTQHSNSYLQAVSGTYVQTSNFVRCLNPAKNFPKEFHEAASKMVVDVFEKHVELYLVEELDAFRKHSEDVVSDWDRQLSEHAASTESFYMSNVNRQADKKDFLTSFKKVLMAPVNILPGFSKSSTAKGDSVDKPALSPGSVGASHPNRSSTIIVPVTTPPVSNEAPTTELAAKAAIMNAKLEGIRSLFSIEVALNLVHVAKLSLERAAQFVEMQGELGKATRQKCEAIFISLLQILGQQHVIAGFDKAVGHLSVYKPRQQRSEDDQQGVEPLVTFLELVNVGDLILQMMDVFYEQELIGARLIDNSDFLNPAVKEKKRFEQMLDERVAAGLNKGIDVLLEEVEFLLATKQTALDFYPESADGNIQAVDIGPSDAATSIVQIVSSHTQMLVGSTDKSTLDVFNQEVGLRLFGVLCKHLKRQRISIMGSIKLISDMNHYFTFIQTMKNDHLILYFTALREMSQLYLIDPSDSKEMATIIADVDRFKGILRAEEVYEFAERRADWYQVKRDVERAMFGIGCTVI